jgi:hypothetical protein
MGHALSSSSGPAAPLDGAATASPGRRVPLPRRWNRRVVTDEQLLDERVEHLPPTPVCADCGHLGEPIRITDLRGARHFRRACPCCRLGFTAPDWPICPHYEKRTP